MSEKSHVSLECALCPVCTEKHSTGVLIHKRLRPVLERETLTHWELCPACAEKKAAGYVALIGVDKDKSREMSADGVHRLGRVAHLRKEAFENMFGNYPDKLIVFCGAELLDRLEAIAGEVVTA